MKLDKAAIILCVQTLGFFRCKNAEKREEILDELFEMEEYEQLDEVAQDCVREIIDAEVLRRHKVYAAKQSRSVSKQLADAEKPISAGVDTALAHVQTMPRGKYVLTMAQNNTDVDAVLLGALENYCAHNDCKLLIGKVTYNLNGFQQPLDADAGVFYDHSIVKYLVEGHINLGPDLDFIASANVIPTAKNPLSGFESITAVGVSAVIPSSKIALKCTPALKGGKAKVLYGTGSVTKRNYVLRKAGAVAASEHNLGALFVDTTGERAICRQLELMPDSQGFFDECEFYTYNGGVNSGSDTYPSALQFGDIHGEKMEEENLEKMRALLRQYNPEHVIGHDVMDFSSRNHHNVKDCAFIFKQHVDQKTVRDDIQDVVDIIDILASEGGIFHIIESNHDLAINTWLKNADFKLDPTNATVYLECMLALYKHIERGNSDDFNMLQYVYNVIGQGQHSESIIFHGTDESVIIAGVEMGNHGHTGVNGSRGSPTQFRALGVAMNTGHTHTPSICGAVYTAGVTGSLEMGYNIGASSWRLANILTYPNGQRQIIFM